MKHAFLGLLLVFLCCPLAYGEQKHAIDLWLEGAMEADPSTAGMQQAMAGALEKWDAELNKNYKALGKRLRPEAMSKLRDAQRKWIAYRDAEVVATREIMSQVYDEAGGGTMWSLFASDRVLSVTRARALELASYLSTLEIE